MKGLASLIGVVWLFGIALLVMMELTTAAEIMLIGLALYAVFVYFLLNAPAIAFGEKPRRTRRQANRNAGKTYRVQGGTTRKALHDKR